MKQLMILAEKYSFGVCVYLGERFDISIAKIRLFFIYTTFIAVGFPVVFYLLAGVALDIRRFVKRMHHRLSDC